MARRQSKIRDLNQRPFYIWHYTKYELSRAPSCWLLILLRTSLSIFNPFPLPLPFPFADIFFWMSNVIWKITTILERFLCEKLKMMRAFWFTILAFRAALSQTNFPRIFEVFIKLDNWPKERAECSCSYCESSGSTRNGKKYKKILQKMPI